MNDIFSQIFLFFICGCTIYNQLPDDSAEKLKNDLTKRNNSIIFFYMSSGFILASITFINSTNKIPFDNLKILEEKYMDSGNIKVLYFNDKYIFININLKIIQIEYA